MLDHDQRQEQRRIAGRYLLGAKLGRGGMGTVWRATDELLGREVAVKEIVLPAADGSGPGQDAATVRARVLREARAAARLNHPGIVTVHDVLDGSDRIFIVMELVDAPSLAAVVAEAGHLPPARVARIGLGLVDALEVAHAAGIVHRDVKPGNVLVLPGDQVKLADFGIAAVQGDPQLTASKMVMGSPAFMAPEQAGGKAVGPPADWWALGATLYFAVEGQRPFPREHPVAVLAAIIDQPPEPTRRAGPLAPVITALLAKAPEARPSGARLRELLQRAADAEQQARVATAPQATPPLTEPMPMPAAAPVTVPGQATVPLPVGADVTTERQPATAAQPVAAPLPPGVWLEPRRWRERRGSRLAGLVVVAALVALAFWLWHSGIFSAPNPSANAPSRHTTSTGQTGQAASATTVPRAPSTTESAAAGSGQSGSATTETPLATPVTLQTTEQEVPGQILPRFWTSATNQAGGYSVGVPQTWDVSAIGTTTDVEWIGERTFEAAFQVQAMPSSQDPFGWLRGQAATFAAAHKADGYTKVQLTSDWTYKGQPAAAWEFTWFRNKEKTHARWVAFRSGSHTFAVFYRSRDVFWLGGGSAVFPEGFEKAFTPLG